MHGIRVGDSFQVDILESHLHHAAQFASSDLPLLISEHVDQTFLGPMSGVRFHHSFELPVLSDNVGLTLGTSDLLKF